MSYNNVTLSFITCPRQAARVKTLDIIKSCKTDEQLETARKYVELFNKKFGEDKSISLVLRCKSHVFLLNGDMSKN